MIDFGIISSSNNQGSIFACGLLLPEDQENHAITICHEITKNNPGKVKFSLNKATHPPYVRLYETILPSAKAQIATKRMEDLTNKMSSFRMDWAEIEQTENFVAIWGKINRSLKLFHKAVLLEINPLREGYFKEKYIEDRVEHRFTAAEEESFKKWGSPWAEPYIPHMIIAKAKLTFDISKFVPEWGFQHCLFRGLLVGIRSERGDFIHSFQFNFAK